MVGFTFDRPVGAEADVNELEYISALHQTAPVMRTDGTIKAEDISVFLRSRYGLVVEVDEVRETILEGMGGSSTAEEVVDLMELAAILLIPTLLKAARKEWKGELLSDAVSPPPPGLLERAVTMILEDVTGSSKPALLTADLMKRILISYGEWEIAEDDALVEEMIAAADLRTLPEASAESEPQTLEDGGIFLTKESFAAALTRDVQLYDFENQTRLASNFDDVFSTEQDGSGRRFVSDSEMRRQSRLFQSSIAKNENNGTVGPGTSEKMEANSATIQHMGGRKPEEQQTPNKPIVRKFTAPAIDIAAGTFRSKVAFVALWACTLFSFYLFFGRMQIGSSVDCGSNTAYDYNNTAAWSENTEMIKCKSVTSVLAWIGTFMTLCLFGLTYVGLANLGNFVECKRWYMPLIAIFAIGIFAIAAFTAGSKDKDFARYVVIVLMTVIVWVHFTTFLDCVVPVTLKAKFPRLQAMLQPGTLVDERDLKRAAAFKLNRMVKNALELSEQAEQESILASHFGNGLFNYGRNGKKYEQSGGFVWTWKHVFQRGIFREEGVWFSARLVASNASQFLICIFILLQGLKLAKSAHEEYNVDTAQETMHLHISKFVETAVQPSQLNQLVYNVTSLVISYFNKIPSLYKFCGVPNMSALNMFETYCHVDNQTDAYHCDTQADLEYFCSLMHHPSSLSPDQQLAFLGASGFDTSAVRDVANKTMQNAADQAFAYLYPAKQFMTTIPAYVGSVFAFLTAVNLSLTYVPSVTTTILQLRSGVIPTLRDREFNIYRVAPDTVSLLTGSLFWGCLASSILVGGLVAGIIFFFLWQSSAFFAQKVVAIAVGIIAITLIKLVIMLFFRLSFYKGFYRTRPAAANISILALEWANFALSAGFIIIRMVKLLLIASSSIGRVDRRLLDRAAGRIGDLELDGYPSIHMRDVLAHDAHRHPYIEQLGTMYLMKLRYHHDFGRTSGSCWRLLFIYAMMPWFHKYRVMSRPQLMPDIVAEQDAPAAAPYAERQATKGDSDERTETRLAKEPAPPSVEKTTTEFEERIRRLQEQNDRLEKVNFRVERENARMAAENARLKASLQGDYCSKTGVPQRFN